MNVIFLVEDVWRLDQDFEATVPDYLSPVGCGGLGTRLIIVIRS